MQKVIKILKKPIRNIILERLKKEDFIFGPKLRKKM